MKRKVIHKDCGGLVMYYLKDTMPILTNADDFEFLDGSKPVNGTYFSIKCPSCLGDIWILGPQQLVIEGL